MAQKTNLNVSPYFEDFDASKAYHKILFSPGKPIQARELNNLQSQIQNQIEAFGNHIFKDGSVVVPGGLTYDLKYYAIKVNPVQSGINLNIYIKNFVGKIIVGKNSKITATIDYVAVPSETDEIDYITLYVKYRDSGENNIISQFPDSEVFYCTSDVVYGNTTIPAGTTFATSINQNSSAIGSSASINTGVYYVRGYFVEIQKQTIILDYYNSKPSYRIGLSIDESIITAKDDNSLYDNAKGFTNYAAPGADRFSLAIKLDKRNLDDIEDTNFVELLRIDSGSVKKDNISTQYSLIRDYLAKRTYEESGNYSVKPFQITIHESLNDRIGNSGLFFSNEKTEQGNTPSDDLASILISPGSAYVEGYDVDYSEITNIIDLEKPRETATDDSSSVLFRMGNYIRVNNVYGVPEFKGSVELCNERKTSNTSRSGIKIGDARVYSFSLTDAPYSGNSTSWDLYLYDVQTYTKLTLNKPVSNTEIKQSYFIKGLNSGASGYSVYSGDDTETIYIRQTSGTFIEGEKILINGVSSTSRIITDIRAFSINDVKSVFKPSGPDLIEFSADSELQRRTIPNFSSGDEFFLSQNGNLTSPSKFFTGITTGAILSYIGSGNDVHYNKVASISPDSSTLTLEQIPTVVGICTGTIGVSADNTKVDVYLRTPSINSYNDGSLYAELPKSYVSSVNLSNSIISFKSQTKTNVSVSNNAIEVDSSFFDLPVGLTTSSFQAFDQERYSVHWTDGTVEPLDVDKFTLLNNGSGFKLSNISNNTTDSIIGTLVKSGIKSKLKTFNRSKIVNYSYTNTGVGKSEFNLEESDVYGIRIQDKDICLGYPDVIGIIAIYESLDGNYPTFDKLVFSNSSFQNAIITGDNIIGKTNGAVARIVEVTPSGASLEIDIVYLNNNKFTPSEFIEFSESTISIQKISSIIPGRFKDLTKKYSFDGGQKGQYYDYSKIIRNESIPAPSKKLSVVFDYYGLPNNENGDVFTVLSYPREALYDAIPKIGTTEISAANTLDFRPRVSIIDDLSTLTASPFDFGGRDFGNEPNIILSPDEVCILGVEYYLGRIDKLYLDKNGKFVLQKGTSSISPTPPESNTNSMLLCTLQYPPFLDNVSDTIIRLESNKRYTMRDIGKLDNRIGNLEKITTLSLLEIDTKTIEIRDSDGMNMFKSGFFADDFKTNSFIDDSLSRVFVDTENGAILPEKHQNSLPNIPQFVDSGQKDLAGKPIFKSLDGNIRYSGDENNLYSLTLDYNTVGWIEQPFSTRIENVNPFHVAEYVGNVTLNPTVDNWVRTEVLSTNDVTLTSYKLLEPVENVINDNRTDRVDEGLRGKEFDRLVRRLGVKVDGKKKKKNGRWRRGSTFKQVSFSNELSSSSKLTVVGDPEILSSTTSSSIQGVISDKNIRSRNVEFIAKNLKSFTEFYQFLDGRSGLDFISKIIKITPISGTFAIGEDVIGYPVTSGGLNSPVKGNRTIRFKLAAPNHKSGDIQSPQETYKQCPYDREITLPSNYSSSLNYLNIDIASLVSEAKGAYNGYLENDMIFEGQSSGARSRLSSNKLISDSIGDLFGCFYIRDSKPDQNEALTFTVGTKSYRLTSSQTNQASIPGGTDISYAESTYTATGNIIQTTETTTTNQLITQQLQTTTTLTRVRRVTTVEKLDPLAQSFEVGRIVQQAPTNSTVDPTLDSNGAFLVAVDLYFAKVDSGNAPLTVEVRNMSLGTVTLERIGEPAVLTPETVLPNGKIFRDNVSSDGSVATTVVFPHPISLEADNEYAIVLLAPNSLEYEVFTAEFGKPTFEGGQYNSQFAIGSLFKSQNGSIWTPVQEQDLKFKLYKAEFVSNGSVSFNLPEINSNNDSTITSNTPEDLLEVYPRKILIGVNSTDLNLQIDTKVTESGQKDDVVYGTIESFGSRVVGITTIKGGKNYPDGSYTVETISEGSGTGLKLDVTVSGGTVTSSSIASGFEGIGYADGDVVTIVASSTPSGTGSGALITVDADSNYNSILLTNVQGESFTVGETIKYYDENGSRQTTTVEIVESSAVGGFYEGNICVINHVNHGMYSGVDLVDIRNIVSDVPPELLESNIVSKDQQGNVQPVSTIKVSNPSIFELFEGVPVSGTNLGYVKISDEVFSYSGVSNGLLTGVQRSIDGTVPSDHYIGQPVYKYEISGISIRRIVNPSHTAYNINGDADRFYIEIDRSGRENDSVVNLTPQLSFRSEGYVGGNDAVVTKNIIFNEIFPSYDLYGPRSVVSISAQARTVSARSVDGIETPYIDLGYSDIQLNSGNTFNSLRMVASRPNETSKLTELPDSKSFTTTLFLSTTDKNQSPQLFLDSCTTNFISNRVNNPVSNYAEDGRVNEIESYLHNAVYYSNIIYLEKPSTSLKVFLSAYRPASSDIRVLYSLITPDSYEVDNIFTLFPGYNNLTIDNNDDGFLDVVNPALNDGLPDFKVADSLDGEYRDYEFTAPNLTPFIGFIIKVVMASKDQANVPIIRNIRGIALA